MGLLNIFRLSLLARLGLNLETGWPIPGAAERLCWGWRSWGAAETKQLS